MPPVSKVLHSLPQVRHHLSSLCGDQPQSEQRMRGSDGPVLFFSSSSRSKTTEDSVVSSERAHIRIL